MQAEEPSAADLLEEAAKAMGTGEAKLKKAAGKLKADDKSEVDLLAEEAADVRVRIDAAAYRISPPA